MKAQVVEKNGFPKPLGIILIIVAISLICLAQCLFTQVADAQTTGVKFNFLSVEEEPEIQIEEWMIDFSTNENILVEKEPEIKVEPWMYETAFWATSKKTQLANNEYQEEEVKIEPWMYNNIFWLFPEGSFYVQNEFKEDEVSRVYYAHKVKKDK